MLIQELMIGKQEGVEAKNSYWGGELAKIYSIIPSHRRISKLTVPLKYKGLTHTPKSFLQKADPSPLKTADHKKIDPRLV